MDNKVQVQLGLPNIVMKLPSDWDVTLPVEYRYDLFKEFVYLAAREFPQWTFENDGNYGIKRTRRDNEGNTTDYYLIGEFTVRDGREELGHIHGRFNRGAPCVALINHRIYQDMERGSSKETKDTKKAFRLLKKYFGTKTLEEHVEVASEAVARSIRYTYVEKDNAFNKSYNHIAAHLTDYIVENIDTFLPIAERYGADPNIVRSLTDDTEQLRITGEIQQCFMNEKGVVVYLHGRNYAVKELDGTLKVYTVDDVPDTLKRKLGLLKLVENGQCITDVGIRVEENTYFVMEE